MLCTASACRLARLTLIEGLHGGDDENDGDLHRFLFFGLRSTLTASLHGGDDENDGDLHRFIFFGLRSTLTASLHGSDSGAGSGGMLSSSWKLEVEVKFKLLAVTLCREGGGKL